LVALRPWRPNRTTRPTVAEIDLRVIRDIEWFDGARADRNGLECPDIGITLPNGASFKFLSLVGGDRFEINLSVALVLEYESAARRVVGTDALTHDDITDILDYLCLVGNRHRVFYLWRPFLTDPGDDMVLELAVVAQCGAIVTHNLRHFRGADQFGIRALTPAEFLRQIGELP
jgi:predicted nucleic acid-binding protein